MSTLNGELPSIELLGMRIHALRLVDVVDLCDQAIRERRPLHLGVVNAAKLVRMRSDQVLREAVSDSDVILADGMSVVWASRLLGQPLPERCAGIDLMFALLRRAAERGYRVYCLGAEPEVLARAVEAIRQMFPGVAVVGQQHGYFREDQETEIVRNINASRADILFVAITSPKKEQFLARWDQRLAVPVRHGVGGSFDVLAGKVRRAPRWVQRVGLEWAYRLGQEPGRLWKRYFVTNPLFAWLVVKELFTRPKQPD